MGDFPWKSPRTSSAAGFVCLLLHMNFLRVNSQSQCVTVIFIAVLFVATNIRSTAQSLAEEEETNGQQTSVEDPEGPAVPKSLSDDNTDPDGYLIFCPCMGRFGNQADHFLGSLAFAKKVKRTLILPPWRTYKNVPFDEWFQVEAVQKCHKAILAETFMATLAPKVWPEGKRYGFCWKPSSSGGHGPCNMKEGNPFGPFWDGLGVNFDGEVVYSLSYIDAESWIKEYPPDKYPVIALRGAPARYPLETQYYQLQQYLQWNKQIEDEVDEYIEKNFPGETFVAIHLRNGIDWERACGHLEPDGAPNFLSSPQCFGENVKEKVVTTDICFPSAADILKQTKEAVESIGATVVFVGTDNDPMLSQLQDTLGKQVRVFRHDSWMPQYELIMMAKADHFIGNCISSFTSFAVRERQVKNKTVSFWNFDIERKKRRDEL